MSMSESCCICSSILDTFDAKTEKPIVAARHLPCCTRAICQRCIADNPRYKSYCPYCQISTEPSPLPQGLRDPPPYDDMIEKGRRRLPSQLEEPQDEEQDDELPAYSSHHDTKTSSSYPRHSEKPSSAQHQDQQPAQDVLHFLSPTDSLLSLSLAYRVPIDALRQTNNIFADHLVQGRRTLLIPGEHYRGGVSLSPRPLEGEEEEIKKAKVRRWMVACKVPEYDVALLYLEQAEYNLEAAISAFRDDERWEKEHPLDAAAGGGGAKNKNNVTTRTAGMRRFVGGSASSASPASSSSAAAAAAQSSSSSATRA